jgi:hypothetical protein
MSRGDREVRIEWIVEIWGEGGLRLAKWLRLHLLLGYVVQEEAIGTKR